MYYAITKNVSLHYTLRHIFYTFPFCEKPLSVVHKVLVGLISLICMLDLCGNWGEAEECPLFTFLVANGVPPSHLKSGDMQRDWLGSRSDIYYMVFVCRTNHCSISRNPAAEQEEQHNVQSTRWCLLCAASGCLVTLLYMLWLQMRGRLSRST